MHTENLEKHKLMKHYKKLYGTKCRTMSKLQKQLVLKKQENILLQEEIYRLKEKFASHISHNRNNPDQPSCGKTLTVTVQEVVEWCVSKNYFLKLLEVCKLATGQKFQFGWEAIK